MRTILSCFLSLIVLSVLEGQVLDSMGCTGAVGDVKYSILDEAAFQAENGPCWVLLDGRDIVGSRLGAMIGQTNLPDARGYFLRAVDTRSSDRVDTDRNQGQIGTLQDDMIRSHTHTDVNSGYGLIRKSKAGESVTAGSIDSAGSGTEPDVKAVPKSVELTDFGGQETRPKNINLYVYIRIN